MIFKLYACCQIVKGISRAIICDLQRNVIQHIPLGLFEILDQHKDKSVTWIKKNYTLQHDDTIDEYFNYLIEHEFGFWCDEDELECFPKLNLKYETPDLISNAIIDIDNTSKHNYRKIFEELFQVRCKFLEIRIYTEFNIDLLSEIVSNSKFTTLRNVDLFLKYEHDLSPQRIFSNLTSKNTIIGNCYVHSSPIDKNFESYEFHNIYFLKQKLDSAECCGNISFKQFLVNIEMFTESQSFNTCLNRKIAIDVEGNIKNCPSMKKSFGNHENTSILEIATRNDFQQSWNLKKDLLNICSECEYRHICTDCRAFVKNDKDKPAKCNYNPKTMIWEQSNKC